jgi:hypothetical protein
MYIQLDMLRAFVVFRVRRHVYGGDNVAVDHRGFGDAAVELVK